MGQAKLEFDYEGFNEARHSPEIQAELMRIAEAIVFAAGDYQDYEVIDSPSKQRARVVVVTASGEAMKAEAEDRVLSRAFAQIAGGS